VTPHPTQTITVTPHPTQTVTVTPPPTQTAAPTQPATPPGTPTQQRAPAVGPAPALPASTLPVTGPNLSAQLVLATVLIAAGALLGLAGLLRRRARAARHGG
jgi:hypothetical protein